MNSRKLLNISLLALVVGLGAVVTLESLQEPEIPEPKKLSDLKLSDVNHISITLNSGKRTLLEQTNNLWRIVEPVNIAANESQIFSLSGILNTVSYGQYKVDEQNLSKYGLNPPSTVLRFGQKSFALGDEDPVNNNRYVLFDNTVHLIRDSYSTIANSAPSSLISLALLPKDRKIKSLQLLDKKLDLIDGSWQVTPSEADITQDALQQIIDEWQLAQALTVSILGSISIPKKEFRPIRIEFNDDKPAMAFEALLTEDELLLRNPEAGVQYHLTSDAETRLFNLTKSEPTP